MDAARSIAVVAALLLASPAGAQPAVRPLGLGFYAPELAVGPYKRFAYVQGLARHLSDKLGRPVRGYVYKREQRLQQDIRSKRLDVVVLGGLYLAASQRPGQVLATGRFASQQAARWSLMGTRPRSLAALRGKTLQLPRVGRIIYGLVENGLLDGNLNIRRHFRIVISPDQISAVQAVRIGAAEAVFAPLSTPGLRPLIERALPVPPPALVLLNRALPAPLVQRLRQAVGSWRSNLGALAGWGSPTPAVYRRLAAAARRGRARMVLVPARLLRPRIRALINQDAVKYEYPDLDQLFVIP